MRRRNYSARIYAQETLISLSLSLTHTYIYNRGWDITNSPTRFNLPQQFSTPQTAWAVVKGFLNKRIAKVAEQALALAALTQKGVLVLLY